MKTLPKWMQKCDSDGGLFSWIAKNSKSGDGKNEDGIVSRLSAHFIAMNFEIEREANVRINLTPEEIQTKYGSELKPEMVVLNQEQVLHCPGVYERQPS